MINWEWELLDQKLRQYLPDTETRRILDSSSLVTKRAGLLKKLKSNTYPLLQ